MTLAHRKKWLIGGVGIPSFLLPTFAGIGDDEIDRNWTNAADIL